ncbi:MAG: tetratricopeptide repeat protein [Thermonemataceae bacterium]|nr:tetratricopeptide repeat protein [Thermonemataceae bacterium]
MKKTFILFLILSFWSSLNHLKAQDFVELYQKMAQEAKAKNYAQAATYGEQAEPLAQKAIGKDSAKYASFYYNLAGFQVAANQAEKAEISYKKCLDIRRKHLGVQHPDYIKTIDKLAQLYTATGKQNEANKLLAQLKKDQNKPDATTENNTAAGKDSPEYAKTLTNQAVSQMQTKKWKEAEKNLLEALAIYQKNKIESPDFATTANLYALLISQKGKYKEALPLFEKSYEIRKKSFTENNPLSQEVMLNLAVCYEETKQSKKAKDILEALKVSFEKTNKTEDKKYIEVLAVLGRFYLNEKELTKAEQVLQIALEKEKKQADNTVLYPQLLNDLARLAFMKQDYTAAENYARLANEFAQEKFGKNTPEYANSLFNLGGILQKEQKNAQAEKIYQQSLQLLKQIKQEKSDLFLQVQSNLANLYASEKRYDQAIKIYTQVLPQQKLAEENQQVYWQNLANLADCYVALQKYKEAKPIYEELINIEAATQSEDYPQWLMNLGAFYHETGKYQEAEAFFEQSLQIYQNNLSNQNDEYIEALENLANLYKNQGRYTDSERLYQQALATCKTNFGENHPVYINLENDLANLYKSLGRFEDAEKIYQKNLQNASKQGENTAAYAKLLNDLAVLYKESGKFAETEPLLSKSLEIRKKIFTEQSAEYAETLQNLASLYKLMGRYQEAATSYQKTLQIRKEVLGSLHPDYATTLNTLATLYKKTNNLDKAEPLYLEALEIRKAFVGEENPEYAFSLDNLANFYQATKQTAKAEQFYKQAIDIRKKIYGTKHPIYAGSLNNLAVLYESNKKYTQAEPLYKEAFTILRNNLGETHPKFIATLNNMAMFYESQQKFKEATPLFRLLAQNTLAQIQRNFSTLSENEKRDFFATNKPYLDNFILFAANSVMRKSPDNEILSREAFQLLVATKGIVLNSTGKARKEILQSNDKNLITQYEEWVKIREMIAKLYNMGGAELKNRQINIDSLENRAKNLEKQLSTKSKAFSEAFNTQLYTWEDFKKQLKTQEALVEILRVQGEQDKVYYIAFIIKESSQNAPEVLIFNNGADLELTLAYYKNSVKFRKEDKKSYEMYWKPFEEKLQNLKKVYFSADGVFTQINPSTLFDIESKQYLLEKLDVAILTNAKDLLEQNKNTELKGKALLLGNPTYEITTTANNEKPLDLENQDSFWLRNSTFITLPATEDEVKSIQRSLDKNKKVQVKLLLQQDASETKLKEEIAQSNIIHLATHGFFIPSKAEEEGNKLISFEENTEKEQDDPMLRSGLILAGVSDYFRNNQKTKSLEDGILTAYEVMNLKLENVGLVVLSACETGLGKVQAGEGVYGLQRAFKIAGTECLMMSLWKVDDAATKELMELFYEELAKNNNKNLALKNAQTKLRQKYAHPYYWGAFIMIGE